MTFRRSLFSFLLFVLVRSTEGRESASRVDTTTGFLYRRPFDVRGGSSSPNSFQARTPGKVQGVPGQTSPSSFTTARPNPQSREQEDVSTKEMIDSFLTRDSRNSFIGACLYLFVHKHTYIYVTQFLPFVFAQSIDLHLFR